MRERPGLTRLRDLLGQAGARFGLEGTFETGTLRMSWPDMVGSAVAAHAEPTSLRGGVLRVRAESPVWATEVSYLGEAIRTRANEILGRDAVAEVRVWCGPGRIEPTRPIAPTRAVDPHATSEEERAEDPETALERARDAYLKRRAEGP